ncbi:glycosyltransferase, partial [Falsiroseomonas oryziterrae]|uniref:glycosyltransferase n=1 Tax=Falsiroseomonas oryziterrae TaxID=2911368 RepID=UPI001F1E743A
MIGLLHRYLWQRLPYGLRRAALFRATTLAAPRPRRGVEPAAPLIVAGTLRAASGLGESARLCLEALRAEGVAAIGLDLTEALRQPAALPPPAPPHTVDAGPGTLILHVNAPLTGLALLAIGRRLLSGKHVIGCWNWELPIAPPEWRLGAGLVHEIWALTHFVADAVRPVAGDRAVHVVPPPVALRPVPQRRRRTGGSRFTVLSMFDAASSLSRKNPEGVIEAFRRAFGADPTARLLLKTQRLGEMPQEAARLAAMAAGPNIEIRYATLDAAGLDALYDEADVLLSLHRAEGFGLSLAEAMLRGLPVVATGWSGNADFLTPGTGIPVPWRLVPAQDPQRTYDHPDQRWAEPDLDAAATALRRLRDDPAEAARLGAAAAA